MNSPTILFLFPLFSFFGCKDKVEPEKFLLPNHFKGLVTVHYNQPEGKEIKYDKEARVYGIDENGELRTKFTPNIGGLPYDKLRFFHKTPEGEKRIKHQSQMSRDYSGLAVRGPFLTDYRLFIIVDELGKLDNYPNPAIEGNERQCSRGGFAKNSAKIRALRC